MKKLIFIGLIVIIGIMLLSTAAFADDSSVNAAVNSGVEGEVEIILSFSGEAERIGMISITPEFSAEDAELLDGGMVPGDLVSGWNPTPNPATGVVNLTFAEGKDLSNGELYHYRFKMLNQNTTINFTVNLSNTDYNTFSYSVTAKIGVACEHSYKEILSVDNTTFYHCDKCGQYFYKDPGVSAITEYNLAGTISILENCSLVNGPVCGTGTSWALVCTEHGEVYALISTEYDPGHGLPGGPGLSGTQFSTAEELAASIHSGFEHVPYKAPTVKEAGNIEYWHCPACEKCFSDASALHEITKEETLIPAIDCEHVWDAGKITTPATCAREGVKTFTCTICGETKTEAIPVDKNAHDWDEGKITKPATDKEAGEKTYTCKNDPSHTKTESIPPVTPTPAPASPSPSSSPRQSSAPTNNPKTGDDGGAVLWLSLLLLGGGASAVVLKKRSRG